MKRLLAEATGSAAGVTLRRFMKPRESRKARADTAKVEWKQRAMVEGATGAARLRNERTHRMPLRMQTIPAARPNHRHPCWLILTGRTRIVNRNPTANNPAKIWSGLS